MAEIDGLAHEITTRKSAFSRDQLVILNAAYDKGLRQFSSTADKQKLLDVASAAQLEVQQVKNFISNRNAHERHLSNGTKRIRAVLGKRKISPFNVFASKCMTGIGGQNLPSKVSNEWAEVKKNPKKLQELKTEADRVNADNADMEQSAVAKKRAVLAIKKKMCVLMNEANDKYGTDFMCCMHDAVSGDVASFGTKKGLEFLSDDMQRNFAAHFKGNQAVSLGVRQQVQELYNKKYSLAVGIEGSHLSYKEVHKGTITAVGLPAGVSLKAPSSYGVRTARQILKCSDSIFFSVCDASSTPAESSASGLSIPSVSIPSASSTTAESSASGLSTPSVSIPSASSTTAESSASRLSTPSVSIPSASSTTAESSASRLSTPSVSIPSASSTTAESSASGLSTPSVSIPSSSSTTAKSSSFVAATPTTRKQIFLTSEQLHSLFLANPAYFKKV